MKWKSQLLTNNDRTAKFPKCQDLSSHGTKALDKSKEMPVVLRVKGYRFWFYEADLDEPPHIHVGKEGEEAKYWVESITLARPGRFREHELHEIEQILAAYKDDILEAWRKEQQKRGNR